MADLVVADPIQLQNMCYLHTWIARVIWHFEGFMTKSCELNSSEQLARARGSQQASQSGMKSRRGRAELQMLLSTLMSM